MPPAGSTTAISSKLRIGIGAGPQDMLSGLRPAGRFWQARAAGAGAESEPTGAPADINRDASAEMPVALSPETTLVNEPCIVGDLITMQPALHHPGLERPVAFLGGWRVAPLLRPVRPGIALGELMSAWQIPTRSTPTIAAWLLDRRVLTIHHSASRAEEASGERSRER